MTLTENSRNNVFKLIIRLGEIIVFVVGLYTRVKMRENSCDQKIAGAPH